MATIREKRKGQWQVRVRCKGWPPQNKTFRSKKEALGWARKVEHEMDRGIFVDQSAALNTTYGDLIEIYLEKVTANRPSENSRVSEKLRLKRFMREEPKLCSYAVAHLKPDHFEDYRDRRLKQIFRGKQIKPGTVKRELTTLKRVIDYRKQQLGLLVNPINTEDVKRPVVRDERDVRLTMKERLRLYQACDEARVIWLRPLVELGFETGARRGNLLRLEWCDVNLAKRTAILRGMKNSRNPEEIIDHSIGLTPRAVEILEDYPRSNHRIFTITENAFRKAFNRARERAGLEHFCFHDTRHERVSSLFEAGWSMPAVMAQSGHKDPKSVIRYTNIKADFLANELAKLG